MRDPNPTFDLMQLVDVRRVEVSEPDEAVHRQECLIKQLTSGVPMEVRELSGDWLEIEPDFSAPGRNATDVDPKDPSQ